VKRNRSGVGKGLVGSVESKTDEFVPGKFLSNKEVYKKGLPACWCR